MKILKYCILLFFLIGVFSCAKKKYPESISENEPVFYSKLKINNTPLELAAGVNGYRLYSSFERGSDSIYGFMGEFKQSSCASNCPNTLKIQINDSRISLPNASVNIDSALYTGKYLFNTPEYAVIFQAQYNKTAATYFWDFGDGTSSTSPNPQHRYKKVGNYTVSLKITGDNGCESTLTNLVKVGKANACQASVSTTLGSGNTVLFNQSTSGAAPFKYLWSFGDGSTSELASPSHNYKIRGSYPVKLTVVDANNDTAIVNYNLVTPGDVSSCATNFNAFGLQAQSKPFSKITLTWVDENGVLFTSNNSSQPSSSSFQIISVENYDNNENNQATKKVHIKFNCKVYNGLNSISVDDAEILMCVAYK